MAPIPASDHSISYSERARRGENTNAHGSLQCSLTPRPNVIFPPLQILSVACQVVPFYTAYGPLFAALAGARYAVAAHAVAVRGPAGAVANAFATPGGPRYVVALVGAAAATLEIRGVEAAGFEALYPGEEAWSPVPCFVLVLFCLLACQVRSRSARRGGGRPGR